VVAPAACGGKRTVGTSTPEAVPDAAPGDTLVKQTFVHFDAENTTPDAATPHTRITLVVTNETGAAKSYPVDEVDAACISEAGGEMEALGTLRCELDGLGADYLAVARHDEIILLRKTVRPGEDDNDYEELSRIAVPVGSKLAFSS
jgi:hypothetical protein